MDTSILYCICGASSDKHVGKDHPFVQKSMDYDPSTWLRAAYPYPNVNPPSSVYIQVEDRLRVTGWNAFTLAGEIDLTARILRPDGVIVPIRSPFVLTAAATPQSFELDLTEGFLLSVALDSPTSSIQRGELFCIVTLIRATGAASFVDMLLISDYLSTNLKLGWPNGVQRQTKDGSGFLRSFTQPAPAAGAELIFPVPAHQVAYVHSIQFSLTTAVAVGNREVTLVVDDGANVWEQVPSAFTQVASLTHTYCYGVGLTQFAAAQALLHVAPLSPYQLSTGFRVRTLTTNIQVADQYSAGILALEQWPEL